MGGSAALPEGRGAPRTAQGWKVPRDGTRQGGSASRFDSARSTGREDHRSSGVALFDEGELPAEPVAGSLGEQRRAVPRAFAAADHDLMALEVDVLHPEGETLVEAKASAVEELGDEAVRGVEVVEEGEDIPRGEHGREMMRAVRPDEVVQVG